MRCRYCNTELSHVFIDLVNSPASNSFLTKEQLNEPETFFPLKVYTCQHCYLVQVDEYKKSDAIFNSDYVYFSSFSTSWLQHAKTYTEKMIPLLGLTSHSQVVEIASNDGYLLQYFKEKQIPVLGIEPTANTAAVAIEKGISTIIDFFGTSFAKKLVKEQNIKADLIIGNNVLAHVPDINDFVGGLQVLLAEGGTVTMEFPHLLQLIEHNQFDTIYHEHFSYLSLFTVGQIFASKGLGIYKVEELPTHGGSLRIYAKHMLNDKIPMDSSVGIVLEKERTNGIGNMDTYKGFQEKALAVKLSFLEFLIEQKRAGKKVAGYGAAAKGNTLLNFCGVKNDLIEFVVDANPNKQNKWLPASHIPVVNEEHLKSERPDFVIIFPWNIKEEIIKQLAYIREWNGKFVIPIPSLEIL
jgi:2-polyprenyl-3-methyl-5-hydroxy-6-metoxy-1,4-benzoquinol methylase